LRQRFFFGSLKLVGSGSIWVSLLILSPSSPRWCTDNTWVPTLDMILEASSFRNWDIPTPGEEKWCGTNNSSILLVVCCYANIWSRNSSRHQECFSLFIFLTVKWSITLLHFYLPRCRNTIVDINIVRWFYWNKHTSINTNIILGCLHVKTYLKRYFKTNFMLLAMIKLKLSWWFLEKDIKQFPI